MFRQTEAMYWALPALGWLAGLALLQQCPRLPSAGEAAALTLGLGVSTVAAWRWRSAVLLALAALLLAFGQGAWRADLRLAESLPEAWEGRDVLLLGTIASLPSAAQGQGGTPGWRFEFRLDEAHAGPSLADPALKLPPHVMLSVFGEPGGAAPDVRAGERWQWVARLKRPHGLMNPFAFDYELWMFEQDLRATGVVRPGTLKRLGATPSWSLDGWRQRLRDALNHSVSDLNRAGVLAALSLGDQNAIAGRGQ